MHDMDVCVQHCPTLASTNQISFILIIIFCSACRYEVVGENNQQSLQAVCLCVYLPLNKTTSLPNLKGLYDKKNNNFDLD